MHGLTNHFKDPLNLILALLVVLSILGTWQYGKQSLGIDYYVAWVAADAVKHDTKHNIYDPESRYKLAYEYRNLADATNDAPRQKQVARGWKQLPMTATPFLYWLTGMLATGDFETDLDIWHALSILSLTVSILVMCRLLGYSTATGLAFLIPVLVWFSPFHIDLEDGNVNAVQLGMIALTLWFLKRGSSWQALIPAGLSIGLMVMFKPNLAPVALLLAGGWLLRRQYANLVIALAGMAAGALIAVVISSWWLGNAGAWLDWLETLHKTVDGFGRNGGGYAGISGLIGQRGPAGQLTTAVIFCLATLAVFYWGRRRQARAGSNVTDPGREFRENSLLLATGCIVFMMSSALVWRHYYLLTVPMFLMTLQPWPQFSTMNITGLIMARLLPAVALLCMLDSALLGLLGLGDNTYWITVTMVSTLILFIVGLWKFAFGISAMSGPPGPGEPGVH